MLFLYDNIAVLATGILVCSFAWLFGGFRSEWLLPFIPWLWAFMLEIMLCFPQRHAGETTYAARSRVWKSLKQDPVLYLVLAFVILLLIPFVNCGLCPICDLPEILIGGDEKSPLKFLPCCYNRANHLSVVVWFVPALTALLAVRHALLKRGKRLLLEMVVWSGLGLSLIGFIQPITGAQAPLWGEVFGVPEGWKPPYFFSVFGYPNMGADYFVTLFALAIGLWRWKIEVARRKRQDEVEGEVESTMRASHQFFWDQHFMLVLAFTFYASALMTLSRAGILLGTILAIVFAVHYSVSTLARMEVARRVKAISIGVAVIVALILGAFTMLPKSISYEMRDVSTRAVLDRAISTSEVHGIAAWRVWKDYPLFGCGGWGYAHLCLTKLTDDEMSDFGTLGGVNVHNDYLQFMAEHGIVGFGLLVTIVVFLLMPVFRVWRALVKSFKFTQGKDKPPKPIAIFALPAPAFCVLFAPLATLLHAFGDCPLRSPAVLTLFFVTLAAVDGFLPRLKDE